MARLSNRLNPLSSSLLRCHIGTSMSNCSRLFRDESSSNINSFSFENILSDENKRKAQGNLVNVKPARTTKHIKLRPEHGSAAVLVPLCTVNKEPSLLLTLRSRNLVKYRGHVSFPGGNVDESDPDVEFTALRETQEELGIEPSAFDIWGHMNSLPSSLGHRKMVHPILAQIGEIDVSKLKVSDEEVEEVFTVSIRHLCNPDNIGMTRFRAKHSYTLPVYTGGDHRIWGLTAIIIHMLLNIIVPDLYTFKLRHQRDRR